MLYFTRLVILDVFLQTVVCKNITLNIRGDETSLDYYKQFVAKQNIFVKLMDNLFNGSPSSFSMRYSSGVDATDITFFKTDNDSTFFKCWHQANLSNVTCERQTMNQCKLTLSNESCCSNRNSFLWNTSKEFLYSPDIRNFTVNCGNQTNQQILYVYELIQTSTSSPTTPPITSTMKKKEDADNASTGLIIGILFAVILVAALAIISFIIWKKRKQIKNSNSRSSLNDTRPENYENTRQRNVPNLYNFPTSTNVLPVNRNNGCPIPPTPKIHFSDHQPGNNKSNYSNTEYTDPVEDNYTGIVYDVPKPQCSTTDQNVDKIEYYSSNEEVQPRIDDYTTVDSPDVQVGDNTTTDQTDDLLVDYSTIADAVGQENSQRDNLIVREPSVIAPVAKNPYSVLGNNDKNIINPYHGLPPEPDTSTVYFVLLSEGELPQYSMAQSVSGDNGDDGVDGDNGDDGGIVENKASTIE